VKWIKEHIPNYKEEAIVVSPDAGGAKVWGSFMSWHSLSIDRIQTFTGSRLKGTVTRKIWRD
jgi:phosphoribosylpyrophosphate synthetase